MECRTEMVGNAIGVLMLTVGWIIAQPLVGTIVLFGVVIVLIKIFKH